MGWGIFQKKKEKKNQILGFYKKLTVTNEKNDGHNHGKQLMVMIVAFLAHFLHKFCLLT